MTAAGRKSKKRLSPKVLLLTGVFCLSLISGLILIQIARADGRIMPNVSIGDVSLGNLTPDEARLKLEDALRAANLTGLVFSYGDRSLTIKANDRGPDNVWTPAVNYDVGGMVRDAFAYGHEGGVAALIKSNLHALFSDVILPVKVSVNREALKKILLSRFTALEHEKHDADISVHRILKSPADGATNTPLAYDALVEILPGTPGVSFDYDAAIDESLAYLTRWRGGEIRLKLVSEPAAITTEKADGMRGAVLAIMQGSGLQLAYDNQRWAIPPDQLADALTLKIRDDGGLAVGLRPAVLEPLLGQIASVVETEAAPTHLKIENDIAVEFEGGQLGKTLNRQATMAQIEKLMAQNPSALIPVAVDTYSSPDSDKISEQMGIRELLGYGVSNMAGSPKNRRKNIANGARLLNGVLIKPGEEFSLLDHLKPFTDKNGYSKELIIKGNRTVPDYGGGLCQIGTTTFRTTMGAGLPVTMRQNHSYRVRYYEPAGTDATIFDPAPDYRFVNDTANYALLVTKIKGDALRFELWGTRDGRVQKQSLVKMWDVTQPPDPNNIATSELPDGKKKCFEIAHPGATTSFTYAITYPDGAVKKKEFKSLYKPWQEQCLVGKTGAPRIIINKDGDITDLSTSASDTPPSPRPRKA